MFGNEGAAETTNHVTLCDKKLLPIIAASNRIAGVCI
jgi:hypothetical protein